jgi:hypothetical protein
LKIEEKTKHRGHRERRDHREEAKGDAPRKKADRAFFRG